MYNENVCVVILTGGLSKRIGGGNKSLIEFNNKVIFDRIYNNIKKQSKKIIINNNKEKKIFNNYNETIVSDDLKGFLGPLSGIHAAMKWIKKDKENKYEWLITIPGDTPFLPNNLVKKLLKKAISENCEIVLAKSFGKHHPVIGIWNLNLYDDLEKSLKEGVRKILHWASKHTLSYEDFDNPNYDPFFNINYKEDILKAEEIEKKYFK